MGSVLNSEAAIQQAVFQPDYVVVITVGITEQPRFRHFLYVFFNILRICSNNKSLGSS